MLTVTENFKLIDLDIDGKVRTVPINTSDAWNVFKCESESGEIEVNEGVRLSFITENGEVKKGTLTKITGKKGNTKLQIKPEGMEYEEIWEVNEIRENSLKLIIENKEEEE